MCIWKIKVVLVSLRLLERIVHPERTFFFFILNTHFSRDFLQLFPYNDNSYMSSSKKNKKHKKYHKSSPSENMWYLISLMFKIYFIRESWLRERKYYKIMAYILVFSPHKSIVLIILFYFFFYLLFRGEIGTISDY